MTEKLDKIVQRYDFLTEEISKPEVIADNNIWKKLVKEHSSLTPIVECYQELKKTQNELTANIELANVETDKDMLALLHEDIAARKSSLEELEEQLKVLLLPKEKKRLCSPMRFAVCIICLRKRTVGRLKKST